MIIETERLGLSIASDDEMQLLIEEQADHEMKTAYQEMLDGCMEHTGQRQWYAVWFIRTIAGEDVGDYCFKGLGQDGTVEIGYGINPEFWGKGYATEAVKAAVQWALRQPGVKRVEAETDPDNKASQRVLEKTGFVPTGAYGEEGPRFVFYGFEEHREYKG